jgi:hypothetical protein
VGRDTGPWIVARNFDRFQHYHDRSPIWIKCYTDLLHDDDWTGLTAFQRGVLMTIWLEYASSDGLLSLRALRAAEDERIPTATLDTLAEAGWIRLVDERPDRLSVVRGAYEPTPNGRRPKETKRFGRGMTPSSVKQRYAGGDET